MAGDFLQGSEYVLFLLKNYRRLKSEVKFLEMEKQERAVSTVPTLTGCLGELMSGSSRRFKELDFDMLNKAGRIVKGELKDLEDAVETLPYIEKGIVKDIYFNRVSWIGITHKWHISEATISRYRKKAFEKIWHYMTRGISCECEGVIECVKHRKANQTKKASSL